MVAGTFTMICETKRKHNTRIAALGSILLAASILTGCGKGANESHAQEKKGQHEEVEQELVLTSEEVERAGIKTEHVKAAVLGEHIVVTATIGPDQDRVARVSPRIEARITSAPVKLGDSVRRGQTLAVLDSVEVGEAHVAWLQAQSEQRIAEADLTRAEELNAEEIIPRKEYLRAQADREKAASALRAAADRLRLLGGTVDKESRNGSSLVVTAPFAGTVIEKKATLGDLASPAEPMFTVADLSRLWILADLPEMALAKVSVGSVARITVAALAKESFTGRVSYVGAVLDKDSRTVAARIEVANAQGRLKPGLFASASIEGTGPTQERITLPDEAIVLMQGQPSVFVFDAGAYDVRPIEPGDRLNGRTVIRSGLKAGEEVVVAGAYALKARKLKSQVGHGH